RSAAQFPAKRETCSEFLVFRPIRGKTVRKSRTILGSSGKIPYPAEQGINFAEQGIKVPCSVENRDIARLMRAFPSHSARKRGRHSPPTGFTQVDFLRIRAVSRVLLREAGKVPRSGGWGAESRYGSMQVRGDGRAIRLGPKQRATPHPALRATFPSKLGKGFTRRFEMCECRRALPGDCRRRSREGRDEGTLPVPQSNHNLRRAEMAPQVIEKLRFAPENGVPLHCEGGRAAAVVDAIADRVSRVQRPRLQPGLGVTLLRKMAPRLLESLTALPKLRPPARPTAPVVDAVADRVSRAQRTRLQPIAR